MFRYEILMLAVPEITKDEASSLENQLDSLITKNKGKIISFERWGKYRLSYPVSKNEYGVYFLTRFELPQSEGTFFQDLKNLFVIKLSPMVMRNMISRLEPEQSLVYNRPPSLEETPAKTAGSFLREKGLIAEESEEGDLDLDDDKEE